MKIHERLFKKITKYQSGTYCHDLLTLIQNIHHNCLIYVINYYELYNDIRVVNRCLSQLFFEMDSKLLYRNNITLLIKTLNKSNYIDLRNITNYLIYCNGKRLFQYNDANIFGYLYSLNSSYLKLKIENLIDDATNYSNISLKLIKNIILCLEKFNLYEIKYDLIVKKLYYCNPEYNEFVGWLYDSNRAKLPDIDKINSLINHELIFILDNLRHKCHIVIDKTYEKTMLKCLQLSRIKSANWLFHNSIEKFNIDYNIYFLGWCGLNDGVNCSLILNCSAMLKTMYEWGVDLDIDKGIEIAKSCNNSLALMFLNNIKK